MIAAADRSLAPPARAAVDVVAIGGSAGALEPLREIVGALPGGFPVPVVVVLHLPRTGPSALAEVIASRAGLAVREAQDKEPLSPGVVHVAPPGYHVLVDAGPALALSVDDPVHFSIPSIDVLFESAAATCGARVAGVVLSGASADGAAGLAAIRAAGGVVAVQAPADAAVPTMPSAALARCPGAAALPVAALAALILSLAPAGAARKEA